MSGPWDRPSSPSPDDQDWPAEDLESPPTQPSADPWSADDSWQQSTAEPSPGWDVWPPPAPAPDDYVIEEPEPPSSDPWAESWGTDVPDMPFAGDAAPPADPADAPASAEAAAVAPWAADEDPWGAATVEPWKPAEPWRDETETPPAASRTESIFAPPVREPRAEPGPASEPEPEPEREPEAQPEPEPEPGVEPEPDLETGPVTDDFAALPEAAP